MYVSEVFQQHLPAAVPLHPVTGKERVHCFRLPINEEKRESFSNTYTNKDKLLEKLLVAVELVDFRAKLGFVDVVVPHFVLANVDNVDSFQHKQRESLRVIEFYCCERMLLEYGRSSTGLQNVASKVGISLMNKIVENFYFESYIRSDLK